MRPVRKTVIGRSSQPASDAILGRLIVRDPKLRDALVSQASVFDSVMRRLAMSKVSVIGMLPDERASHATATVVTRTTRLARRVDTWVTEQLIDPALRVFMSPEQLLRSCGYR